MKPVLGCAYPVPEKTGLVAGFVVSLLLSGAPRGTRTPNLLVRSQMLYPIELSAQPGDAYCATGIIGVQDAAWNQE